MNSEQIRKAIENNSNYWERRALENKLNIIENEEDYVKRLSAIFDKANSELEEKLAKVYARYAKENKLTLEQAYQILPIKLEKAYKNDVMDYIEKAKSGDTKWKQYLLNQSMMHKHSVLDQLRTEMRQVVYNIDMETTGGKFLEKIYANANYYEQYTNREENFARVDQDKIKRLLEENWSGGGSFSQTIWKNKEQLVNALDDIVIRGLATGESFDSMADKLSKRMETSKSAAKRLIMTESARMDNEGLLDYYKRTDVTHIEFIATLDMKTSDICRALDGEIIPIEEAKVGLNVPPMHPYCRSVIGPVYEDELENDEIDDEKRAYRDKDTNETKVGNYKDYVEYLEKELDDKEQAKALASKKNDLQTLIKAITSTGTSNILFNKAEDTNDHKDKVYSIQENEYVNINALNEKYNEDYVNEKFAQIKKLVEDEANELVIRVKENALENILEDGLFKNQYSTLTSGGTYNPDWRKVVENNLFNIPVNALPKDRPIYGYISNLSVENGRRSFELQKYGDIKVVLNDNIRNRSYVTMGDSMNNSARVIPSKLTDMQRYSVRAEELVYSKWDDFSDFKGYPEIQIFGGVKLKDIKYIELPEEYRDSKIIKQLKKKKIEVKFK